MKASSMLSTKTYQSPADKETASTDMEIPSIDVHVLKQNEFATGAPTEAGEERVKSSDAKPKTPEEQKDQEKQMKKKQKELQSACPTYSPEAVHAVVASIENNQPLLLIGETGTGKTTIIREAAIQYGKTMYRINLTGQTGREDLVGKYVLHDGATHWQDGLLVMAMREGHWLLLDEVNAALAEVLFVIQAIAERDSKTGKLGTLVLTERDGEHITPHPDFRLFATCNPPSYMGLKDFNTATLSRFIACHIQMMTETQATAHFVPMYPPLTPYLGALHKIIVTSLKLYKDGEVSYCASMRDLDHIGALMEGGLTIADAMTFGLLNKYIIEDERKVVSQLAEKLVTKYAESVALIQKTAQAESEAEKKAASMITELGSTPVMDDARYAAVVEFFNSWNQARTARKNAETQLEALTK